MLASGWIELCIPMCVIIACGQVKVIEKTFRQKNIGVSISGKQFPLLNDFTSVFDTGSPSKSIHRTFRAVFEMPFIEFKHNLIKIGKRRYRNPIYLAREWRTALDNVEYASPAALARHLKISRARVIQILNLLRLSPEVINIVASFGDPLQLQTITERRLRSLISLSVEQQKAQVKAIISKRIWLAIIRILLQTSSPSLSAA